MNILLLSAYDAGSHRYWRRGLINAFAEYRWTELVLPARHFSWRIRGNPLSWLSEAASVLSQPYDLLVATSMVDLATLKGLCPVLAQVPALCYFHENQFEYPKSAQQHASVEPQMVNLYSALAADRVLFNSDFNRRTFLQGADRLLSRLPDHRPGSVGPLLEGKTAVLPVPLDEAGLGVKGRPSKRFTLTWNHRWEYDKAPERLLAALEGALARGVDFDLHLLGEGFRKVPPVMQALRERLGRRVLSWGYLESREAYYRCLAGSHLVLSTSLHEFQGLAMLEGAALGACPLVPDRLSYPELFPEHCRYPSHRDDPVAEAEAMAEAIAHFYSRYEAGKSLPRVDIQPWLWSRLKPRYAEEIRRAIAREGYPGARR
ncbi:DUF3524 domain-containing protein [Motiliproteus sp. SC1-56]|uniref:tRNA-queuosine alpha-mannosyltransferase domain-containing protein n=1 Tax=Motiliproteus sp. SC1-56 TaxID=2799565 RepID=UPI001A8FF4AC|nr:DUF3524 domain-containing protein [Motiliproteus sp. SC1-56]